MEPQKKDSAKNDYVSDNYVNKNIRVQHQIGAEISLSKNPKTFGINSGVSGTLITKREEVYNNSIPSVLEYVNRETQTETLV